MTVLPLRRPSVPFTAMLAPRIADEHPQAAGLGWSGPESRAAQRRTHGRHSAPAFRVLPRSA